MDVTELFPQFRHNQVDILAFEMILVRMQQIRTELTFQVLRFSKLFGPNKQANLPQLWRGVKRKKKKKAQAVEGTPDTASVEDDKPFEWIFDYAPLPPPEMVDSDDEVCTNCLRNYLCFVLVF